MDKLEWRLVSNQAWRSGNIMIVLRDKFAEPDDREYDVLVEGQQDFISAQVARIATCRSFGAAVDAAERYAAMQGAPEWRQVDSVSWLRGTMIINLMLDNTFDVRRFTDKGMVRVASELPSLADAMAAAEQHRQEAFRA